MHPCSLLSLILTKKSPAHSVIKHKYYFFRKLCLFGLGFGECDSETDIDLMMNGVLDAIRSEFMSKT